MEELNTKGIESTEEEGSGEYMGEEAGISFDEDGQRRVPATGRRAEESRRHGGVEDDTSMAPGLFKFYRKPLSHNMEHEYPLIRTLTHV